jgi:prevent-host-death family protein
MPIQVGARDARDNFSDLVGRVYYSGETVIVNRSGKPMVAMISVELYERLIAEREARFAVLERIRQQVPDVSEEEVARDVAEAIAAARRRPHEPA